MHNLLHSFACPGLREPLNVALWLLGDNTHSTGQFMCDMFLKLTNCGNGLQVIEAIYPVIWWCFSSWTAGDAFTFFQGVGVTVDSDLCFGGRHLLFSGLADYLGSKRSSGTHTEFILCISGRRDFSSVHLLCLALAVQAVVTDTTLEKVSRKSS